MATEQHKRTLVTEKTEISTDLDGVYRAAWSPDGKHFAVIGSKGSRPPKVYSVLVYDASSRKVVQVLPIKSPGSILGDIAFSPDGKYLAAGVGVITLWDAHTWQAIRDIEGPYERGLVSGGVRSIAFRSDGKSLAVLYDTVVWPETIVIRTREEGAAWAKKEEASKQDGTFWGKMAKGEILSHLATVMAFDVETKKRIFVQPAMLSTRERSGWFSGNLFYTPDGQYLLTLRQEHHKLKAGEHNRIRTFLEFRDPLTGTIVKEIEKVHVMEITALAVSADGKFAATGTRTLSTDNELNLLTKQWDFIDNKDPVRLWNLADGEKVMEYGPLRGAVRALVFSPDGRWLISCQNDLEKKETIWLWDIASGKLIEQIATPRSGVESFGCVISPDGNTIVMPVIDKIYFLRLQG